MKHLASKEKPTESGWYVWWDEEEYVNPFHVLAHVKPHRGVIMVNMDWDTDTHDYVPIDTIADRLWLKVAPNK